MNNSKIAIDNTLTEEIRDITPYLRSREVDLTKIIEAISRVLGSDEWKLLKSHVFDGVTESLEKRLTTEAKKNEVNSPEIYRLQGQIVWAKKFSKLEELQEIYRLELIEIKKKLNAKV